MSSICASKDKMAVGPRIMETSLAMVRPGWNDGQVTLGGSFVLAPGCSQTLGQRHWITVLSPTGGKVNWASCAPDSFLKIAGGWPALQDLFG